MSCRYSGDKCEAVVAGVRWPTDRIGMVDSSHDSRHTGLMVAQLTVNICISTRPATAPALQPGIHVGPVQLTPVSLPPYSSSGRHNYLHRTPFISAARQGRVRQQPSELLIPDKLCHSNPITTDYKSDSSTYQVLA